MQSRSWALATAGSVASAITVGLAHAENPSSIEDCCVACTSGKRQEATGGSTGWCNMEDAAIESRGEWNVGAWKADAWCITRAVDRTWITQHQECLRKVGPFLANFRYMRLPAPLIIMSISFTIMIYCSLCLQLVWVDCSVYVADFECVVLSVRAVPFTNKLPQASSLKVLAMPRLYGENMTGMADSTAIQKGSNVVHWHWVMIESSSTIERNPSSCSYLFSWSKSRLECTRTRERQNL